MGLRPICEESRSVVLRGNPTCPLELCEPESISLAVFRIEKTKGSAMARNKYFRTRLLKAQSHIHALDPRISMSDKIEEQ
jgi:hypothetical protein